MILTNEMKTELEKIIVSSVEKEINSFKNLECHIPSSIGDKFLINIEVILQLRSIDAEQAHECLNRLVRYDTEHIENYLVKNDEHLYKYAFNHSYTKNLKESIKKDIESNDLFTTLNVSQLNDLIESIEIDYKFDFSKLTQYVYDEMSEIVSRKLHKSITLDYLNNNEVLKDLFVKYPDDLIVGEKLTDLRICDHLYFFNVYQGIVNGMFNETDTYDQLNGEIRELRKTEPDLSEYVVMEILFYKHHDIFTNDEGLLKMIIDHNCLKVIKVDDYYVFNTYFI